MFVRYDERSDVWSLGCIVLELATCGFLDVSTVVSHKIPCHVASFLDFVELFDICLSETASQHFWKPLLNLDFDCPSDMNTSHVEWENGK